MKELNPEVVKIAKNFMMFVKSVRNEFQTERPMDFLVGESVNLRQGWEKAGQVWPAIESPDNYFVTMYTLLENLEVSRSKETWLSIGAGPALYEIWLSKIAQMDFLASDFSHRMCKSAKMIFDGTKVLSGSAARGGKILPAAMDMEFLGAKDNSFDQIIFINALHWAPNWRQVIKEMRRVIKTGGLGFVYLVVSGAPVIEGPDGVKQTVSDISQELVFDELEKNQFEISFSRVMLVKEGQLGKTAKRYFIKARLNLENFSTWREKSTKFSAYAA